MSNDDGVALFAAAHPHPKPWYKRLYWRVRIFLGIPNKLSPDSLETIEINIRESHGKEQGP
jgi:hypothetical protein